MDRRRILVTGGAGFIGQYAVERLLREGHDVVVLDNLDPQVHGDKRDTGGSSGAGSEAGRDGRGQAEFVLADVRDREAVRRALQDTDAVLHLASAVGVGQSMYEMAEYVDANSRGTAVLLEEMADASIDRLVVASSMSIYGEGLYQDAEGATRADVTRSATASAAGAWDPLDASGRALEPVPTPESKCPAPASVYAQTKYDQERLCLIAGESYGIPTTALRFFNVYGPGQALGNPYTGVLAIFGSQVLNGRAPTVFEDGRQLRDFVHVKDVARACTIALTQEEAGAGSTSGGTRADVLNIASGQPRTILSIAEDLLETLDRPDLEPEVTGRFRHGDIRHCIADITAAREVLDYEPQVDFSEGLADYVAWLRGQDVEDRSGSATTELEARGLLG